MAAPWGTVGSTNPVILNEPNAQSAVSGVLPSALSLKLTSVVKAVSALAPVIASAVTLAATTASAAI